VGAADWPGSRRGAGTGCCPRHDTRNAPCRRHRRPCRKRRRPRHGHSRAGRCRHLWAHTSGRLSLRAGGVGRAGGRRLWRPCERRCWCGRRSGGGGAGRRCTGGWPHPHAWSRWHRVADWTGRTRRDGALDRRRGTSRGSHWLRRLRRSWRSANRRRRRGRCERSRAGCWRWGGRGTWRGRHWRGGRSLWRRACGRRGRCWRHGAGRCGRWRRRGCSDCRRHAAWRGRGGGDATIGLVRDGGNAAGLGDGNHPTADGAPGTNAVRGDLARVHAKHRATFRAADVHPFSPTPSAFARGMTIGASATAS
jgi:hypothetical protein